MLQQSADAILRRLHPDDVVVDIGGWGEPFPRANWVIDLMPYESRGLYGYEEHESERFTKDTWIQRDICDRDPLPFADKSVDFVICSHTLEDIRDPIWVCDEMRRIAKAGYIETPSRLEEQTFGVQGPWVGWGHHRWLVEIVDGRLEFVFKHHVMCGRESDRFPPEFLATLEREERVVAFWWENDFEAIERVFIEAEQLDRYLAQFVAKRRGREPLGLPNTPTRSSKGSRAVGQLARLCLGEPSSRRRRVLRRLADL
jgi:hypothetical protein